MTVVPSSPMMSLTMSGTCHPLTGWPFTLSSWSPARTFPLALAEPLSAAHDKFGVEGFEFRLGGVMSMVYGLGFMI